MSGWIFLLAGLVVAMVDFLVGLRFSRMSGEQLERQPDGSIRSPEGIHQVGKAMMLFAPIVFILFAALAFGYLPDAGIETISFN